MENSKSIKSAIVTLLDKMDNEKQYNVLHRVLLILERAYNKQ